MVQRKEAALDTRILTPSCSPLLERIGWWVRATLTLSSRNHIFPKSPQLPKVPTASQFPTFVFKLVLWFFFFFLVLLPLWCSQFYQILMLFLPQISWFYSFISKSTVSLLLALYLCLECCNNTLPCTNKSPCTQARAQAPSTITLFHLRACVFTMLLCSLCPGQPWLCVETKNLPE